jgi:hypothetical protein
MLPRHSFVLVLIRNTVVARPTPGGEPLWPVCRELAIFVSGHNLAKRGSNRRLPQITQDDAIMLWLNLWNRLGHHQ